MILVDHQIAMLVHERGLLKPYNPAHLQPAGYDLALANQFRQPIRHVNPSSRPLHIDPWNPLLWSTTHRHSSIYDLEPHSFVLGCSEEYLKIPSNIVGVCLSRSTYARSGVFTNVTPLEPGWEGQVTIEIVNLTDDYIDLVIGKGIVQVQFHQLSEMPRADYPQRGGRYQGQTGVTQGHS